MKITIDLSDVWTEEDEQSVESAIKDRIVSEVVHAVRESIKKDTAEQLNY